MKTLYDIAKVIRSKNAGPFSITLDVLFDSPVIYQRVKESNLINKQTIAKLYQIPEEIRKKKIGKKLIIHGFLYILSELSNKISGKIKCDSETSGSTVPGVNNAVLRKVAKLFE